MPVADIADGTHAAVVLSYDEAKGRYAVVRIDGEAVDDVRVRADDRRVLEARHVENADGARGVALEGREKRGASMPPQARVLTSGNGGEEARHTRSGMPGLRVRRANG